MLTTFQKSPVYANPPRQFENFYEMESLISDLAASVGLKIEWDANYMFAAILNPRDVPPAWGVLASPLTMNEVWHWLNAYAEGRKSAREEMAPRVP